MSITFEEKWVPKKVGNKNTKGRKNNSEHDDGTHDEDKVVEIEKPEEGERQRMKFWSQKT